MGKKNHNPIANLKVEGINLSVGKRRFTEERNLTKENRKRKAGVINTLKEHQSFV